MQKRKISNKKNKKNCLLLLVGFFLILISLTLTGLKIYESKSNKEQEKELKDNFYQEYEEIRNTPKIEFQEEIPDVVIEQPKEEIKPKRNIDYIGVLKINKINLEKGLVSKNSCYNNVNKNIQILKESDMPDVDKGNLILAGHSGSGYTAFFKNLYKLKINDDVSVFYNGYEYKYKIVNIYDIDKTGTAHIVRNANKNTLTLITCREKTNKQIIIICELVERG